ncbi:MAG: MarC family protein, partial [Planctomycetota bacterium]
AVTDLVSTHKGARRAGVESASAEEAMQSGAVPIGVPLLVGPATVATLIVLLNAYGLVPTLTMFVLNIVVVGVVFWQSERILRLVGRTGALAMGKIASLLLAAIAVKLVRLGIEDLMAGYSAAAP